jgi:uncharacterized ion transporter superfamily protein YfcC
MFNFNQFKPLVVTVIALLSVSLNAVNGDNTTDSTSIPTAITKPGFFSRIGTYISESFYGSITFVWDNIIYIIVGTILITSVGIISYLIYVTEIRNQKLMETYQDSKKQRKENFQKLTRKSFFSNYRNQLLIALLIFVIMICYLIYRYSSQIDSAVRGLYNKIF